MCGVKDETIIDDPRDLGFPLNKQWRDVDKAKVLNNQDR